MGFPANALDPSGVLGTSLQRLYDAGSSAGNGSKGPGPAMLPHLPLTSSSEETLDLTESLLEAVFEISEFDPLPHFSFRDDEFDLGLPPVKRHASARQGHAGTSPVDRTGPDVIGPDIFAVSPSAMDRRKLPRRESECIVSVCPCRSEERLTGERISWLLHSAKTKGRLIDVSMSGVAFHLMESLPAGSRILLRIANRTLDKQVDTQAEVLRSRPAPDGGWDLVCRFQKNLSFEQIHTVGHRLFAATIV